MTFKPFSCDFKIVTLLHLTCSLTRAGSNLSSLLFSGFGKIAGHTKHEKHRLPTCRKLLQCAFTILHGHCLNVNTGQTQFCKGHLHDQSHVRDSGLFSASADFAPSLQVFGGCMSAVIAMEYILKACIAYQCISSHMISYHLISSHSTLASYRGNTVVDCFFQNRRYSETSPAFASISTKKGHPVRFNVQKMM